MYMLRNRFKSFMSCIAISMAIISVYNEFDAEFEAKSLDLKKFITLMTSQTIYLLL